jgi:hypothetical protein
MTAKIAPLLRTIASQWPDARPGRLNETIHGPDVRAELRALLALASAVGRYRRDPLLGVRCSCQGQEFCAGCSVERAWARLSRSSHPGTRSRARGK